MFSASASANVTATPTCTKSAVPAVACSWLYHSSPFCGCSNLSRHLVAYSVSIAMVMVPGRSKKPLILCKLSSQFSLQTEQTSVAARGISSAVATLKSWPSAIALLVPPAS
uniref:Uncharacterized protein n=1 Tax=Triticum urartu TaxID=4572 RepID=A0A8R7PWL6_TRIUA